MSRRGLMRILAVAVGSLGLLAAAPAAAQLYSDGYEFLQAVKKRDGNKATEMLQAPGSTIVNTRDLATGETGLHIVVARRDLVWLGFLIQRGANPDIADKDGVTPLMLATQLGFVDGVETLAKAGAKVDVTDSAGETPLIAAVHRRDVALMRVLLKAGANPDRSDNSGRSARDYARLAGSGSPLLDEIERNTKPGGTDKPVYGPSF